MKHCIKAVAVLIGFAISAAHAADLLEVYQQALLSDPGLKANQATSEASDAGVGISAAAALPTVALGANAQVTKVNQQGYNTTGVTATLTQPVFNVNAWSSIAEANQTADAAYATYQSQFQQFILTVADDYFAIRQNQDTVNLDKANVAFLKQTLDQTQQQYNVGLSTMTDVKQAEANYDTARATLIQDQNALAISQENLATLTGKKYTQLAALSEQYPFVPPSPENSDYWVKQATAHNWALQAARATASAQYRNALAVAGNQLPTVSFVGQYARSHNNAPDVTGASIIGTNSIALKMTWTLFQSGNLVASTLQAANQYEAQEATADGTYRDTVSQTRQDYLAVLAQLSLVQAYQASVTAAQVSLQQNQAQYKVGTQTLVQVLNAVTTLYQAEQNLVIARYGYITAMLQLEMDAGQLSIEDIKNINQYLIN